MYRALRPFVVLGAAIAAATGLRAQFTEVAATVAPRHFLLEMDAVSLSIAHGADSRYEALGVGSTFLTTGLANNWDLQVGTQLFIAEKLDENGTEERDSGMGDLYLRTKWRFYDDPASGTQIALLPYVRLPTGSSEVSDGAVEGGLIIPLSKRLWEDFDLSAMVQLDLRRNADDSGYDTFLGVSAALARQVAKHIGFYGEAGVGKLSGRGDLGGTLGVGLIWTIADSMSWDFAAYHGVGSGATDWNYVIRLTWGFKK